MSEYKILDFLKSMYDDDIYIDAITISQEKRRIYGKLKVNGTRTTLSYMEPGIRSFCTYLATELRDLVGKNVYFDIKRGLFTLIF